MHVDISICNSVCAVTRVGLLVVKWLTRFGWKAKSVIYDYYVDSVDIWRGLRYWIRIPWTEHASARVDSGDHGTLSGVLFRRYLRRLPRISNSVSHSDGWQRQRWEKLLVTVYPVHWVDPSSIDCFCLRFVFYLADMIWHNLCVIVGLVISSSGLLESEWYHKTPPNDWLNGYWLGWD